MDDSLKVVRGLVFAIALAGCDRLLGLSPLEPPDARTQPPQPPQLVAAFLWPATVGANPPAILDIQVTLDAPADYCLASVGLSGDSSDPNIAAIAYAGAELSPIGTVQGIDGYPESATTLSAQWGLAAPSFTSGHLVVSLGAAATAAHASVMFFSGVNPDTPIRMFASVSGDDTSSTLSIPSDAGDLVECVTGQGNMIVPQPMPPGVFTDNGSTSHTLDNAAGEVLAGIPSYTTLSWAYANPDYYQTMGAALEPR